MPRICLTVVALIVSVTFSFSQERKPCNQNYFNDTLLNHLSGQWLATGKIGNEAVVYEASVSWILNHQFLELNLTDTASSPVYVAKVIIGYDCDNYLYVAHWIDNFGGRFSETLGYGTRQNQSIVFKFDYPEGTLQNTFTWNVEDKTWTSQSVVQNEMKDWNEFGTITFRLK